MFVRRAIALMLVLLAAGCDRVGGLFGRPPMTGKVWYVKPGGTGDGSSWANPMGHPQDAMDAANSDDELWVAGGTYYRRVVSDPFVLTMETGVSIYGGFAGTETSRGERDWVANVTILDGQGVCLHVVSALEARRLDGFTMTGGNANGAGEEARGGGMLITDSTATIANCTFSNNSAVDVGGGMANLWSSPTVTNCTFSGNTAGNGGGAMFNTGSSSPLVSNCVFTSNSGGGGGALHNNGSAAPTIVNCTFTANTAVSEGGAIYARDSSVTTVENCIFWGDFAPSGQEIYVLGPATLAATYSCIQGGWGGAGNILFDPLFVDAAGWDLHLSPGSPCIDAADGSAAPAADIEGNPRHDDTGITDTGTGSPTYADMGAYEFQDTTVPVWYVKTGGAGDGSSWANAFGHPQDAEDAALGDDEIWVAGGTYTRRTGSDTVLLTMKDGVSIYGGFAGTEALRDDRDWIANETILDGQDVCLHVVVGASNATLDGFTITRGNGNGPPPDNGGGGMWNIGFSLVTITNCTFSNNTATSGGAMITGGGSYTVTNCTFWSNTAWYGGAIFHNGDSTLTNCSFWGNSASDRGGVIDNGGAPTFANCVLWGNSPQQIYDESGFSSAVSYSCIQGGWGGTGNILSDPLFINAGAGDLHLQASSPCIDAADGDEAPAADIEGNSRYDDPGTEPNTGTGSPNYADMGAHEYQ